MPKFHEGPALTRGRGQTSLFPQQPSKSVGPQLHIPKAVPMGPVHQLPVAAVPVHVGMNKVPAEVEQAHQLPVSLPPAEGQNLGTAALLHPSFRLGVKAGLAGPNLLQPPETLEELPLVGIRVLPPLRQVPEEVPPVEIAAVLPLVGVLPIAPVVELPHLVAAVNHGDTALAQHPSVEG